MNFEQIIAEMKSGTYNPLYFLYGEEPWHIDKIAQFAENNVLEKQQSDFNLHVLYGLDTSPEQLVEIARRFPVMAERQLVILKEAQELKKIEGLEPYIKNPTPTTMLMLCYKYKKPDKRKSFTKLLLKQAVVFESKKIYDDKVPAWIMRFAKDKGYSILPDASVVLAESTGNDLGRIENEIEKIIINSKDSKQITVEDIERYTGISREYNNFELQKALGLKDSKKAAKIALYMSKNQKKYPIAMTLALLYGFFSKLLICHFTADKTPRGLASALKINPYFVKDYIAAAGNYSPKKISSIIQLMRDCDLKSKGVGNVGASQQDLIKELLYGILR